MNYDSKEKSAKMNKLKTFKYKTGTNDAGLFDKISKRYSTYRFMRKSPGRQKAVEQPVSGSYDMTGHESDDHKLEIGAPVLISSTTLDSDREVEVGTDGPCMINDGVRVSGSERSTTGSSFGGELKFSFFAPAANTIRNGRLNGNNDIDDDDLDYDIPKPSVKVTNGHCYNAATDDDSADASHQLPLRSKSAMDLDRSNDTTLCTQRTPSLNEFDHSGYAEITTFTASALERQQQTSTSALSQSIDNIRVGGMPAAQSTPIARTPAPSSLPPLSATASQSPFKASSKLSVNHASNLTVDSLRRGHSKSRDSLGGNSSGSMVGCADEEFDLKSASCHSLNARNLYLSIEELNDITQQINAAEEMQSHDDDDLEYCAHRDNLRPIERRITLLRNKNHRLINMGSKRDKITNAWSGFKTWIGEEKGKLSKAVQRHAALQRVGANFRNKSGSTPTLVNGSDQTDGKEKETTTQNGESSDLDAVQAGTSASSQPGSTNGRLSGNHRVSAGQDSMSEFSSLDGEGRRIDSFKKRKSSESRTDSQSRGRSSNASWEVNLFSTVCVYI